MIALKTSDDNDAGYGSDESLANVLPVKKSTSSSKIFKLCPDSKTTEDKGNAENQNEMEKPPLETNSTQLLGCDSVPVEQPTMSRWHSKKIRNKFRVRKTIWKEFLGADCFKFRAMPLSRGHSKDDNAGVDEGDVKTTDVTRDLKDSSEGTDLRLETKKPLFGVDYENIELGKKLNHKLRPTSSRKFHKIRLHLKPKLNIWEMGKTFRKHLQACLRSAEKRKTNGKADAEVQCGSDNISNDQTTNNISKTDDKKNNNADSNLINFVVDAQTISEELPIDLASMLIDLQSRDLTPEDYEMLLMLDDSLAKKCLPRSTVDLLPVSSIGHDDGSLLISDIPESDVDCRKDGMVCVEDNHMEDNNSFDKTNVADENRSILRDDQFVNKVISEDGLTSETNQAVNSNVSSTIKTTTTTITTTRATAVIINFRGQDRCTLESTNVEVITVKHPQNSSVTSADLKTFHLAIKLNETSQSHSLNEVTPPLPLPDLIPISDNACQQRGLPLPEKQTLDVVCTICQEHFEIGQKKVTLPCSHFFHLECGIKWLTESSKNCPLDGLEVCVERQL